MWFNSESVQRRDLVRTRVKEQWTRSLCLSVSVLCAYMSASTSDVDLHCGISQLRNGRDLMNLMSFRWDTHTRQTEIYELSETMGCVVAHNGFDPPTPRLISRRPTLSLSERSCHIFFVRRMIIIMLCNHFSWPIANANACRGHWAHIELEFQCQCMRCTSNTWGEWNVESSRKLTHHMHELCIFKIIDVHAMPCESLFYFIFFFHWRVCVCARFHWIEWPLLSSSSHVHEARAVDLRTPQT